MRCAKKKRVSNKKSFKALDLSVVHDQVQCATPKKRVLFLLLVPEAEHVAIRIAGVSAFLHEPLDLLLFTAQELSV
jgi:hypothetical protein